MLGARQREKPHSRLARDLGFRAEGSESFGSRATLHTQSHTCIGTILGCQPRALTAGDSGPDNPNSEAR